jgi:hypothetical protein|tara:strand:- start:214 stop:438 length:225 start_codon:yes stop_codon:yes gene_type:complete
LLCLGDRLVDHGLVVGYLIGTDKLNALYFFVFFVTDVAGDAVFAVLVDRCAFDVKAIVFDRVGWRLLPCARATD